MVKHWYKDWFGSDYLTVYAHRNDDEARQLIRLIERQIVLHPHSRILDVCCGPGRHAFHLANLGYRVIGIDLSRTLLDAAKAQSASRHLQLIQADMRWLPVRAQFDLVLNLFTSFGYFETDHDNQQVFRQLYSALKPDGQFVFDYFNRSQVEKTLIPYHREQMDDVVIEQERNIVDSRVTKRINLIRDDQVSTFYESVKLYSPQQIKDMLNSAGLKINHIAGNYDGGKFTEESPRLIVFGARSAN